MDRILRTQLAVTNAVGQQRSDCFAMVGEYIRRQEKLEDEENGRTGNYRRRLPTQPPSEQLKVSWFTNITENLIY